MLSPWGGGAPGTEWGLCSAPESPGRPPTGAPVPAAPRGAVRASSSTCEVGTPLSFQGHCRAPGWVLSKVAGSDSGARAAGPASGTEVRHRAGGTRSPPRSTGRLQRHRRAAGLRPGGTWSLAAPWCSLLRLRFHGWCPPRVSHRGRLQPFGVPGQRLSRHLLCSSPTWRTASRSPPRSTAAGSLHRPARARVSPSPGVSGVRPLRTGASPPRWPLRPHAQRPSHLARRGGSAPFHQASAPPRPWHCWPWAGSPSSPDVAQHPLGAGLPRRHHGASMSPGLLCLSPGTRCACCFSGPGGGPAGEGRPVPDA